MEKFVRFIPTITLLLAFSAIVLLQSGKGTSPAVESPDILGEMQSITLDQIFAPDHTWAKNLPGEKTVTIMATGDVMPARSVNYKMVTQNNFRWPFEKTADVLSDADLTVINLETPLVARCKPTNEGMIFCGDPRAVEGLTFAGVDVATLGNNHAGNYDEQGVEETKTILTQAGILPVTGGVAYKEVKGTRFALLSYNDIGSPEPGVPWADENKMKEDIAEAREHADIVIVAYHWGVEYVTEPNARQRELAHLAINAGADVILGNHPHWVQPVEQYKDKFVMYAHGNFVFDQEWSEETKRGVVGRYTFYEGKLVDVEYLPIRIVDYGQPYFLEGQEARSILTGMHEASVALPK